MINVSCVWLFVSWSALVSNTVMVLERVSIGAGFGVEQVVCKALTVAQPVLDVSDRWSGEMDILCYSHQEEGYLCMVRLPSYIVARLVSWYHGLQR